MSIGNLKDTGNQGNNLPYQWRVLQGLQAILDEVAQPLTCVDDSIKICDANGDTLSVNGDGSIDVNIIKAVGIYPEDNSHTTGDKGSFILAVRNDLNTAMTNADGDYSPIAVNNKGAVAINDGGNSITVDGGTGLLRTTGMIRPAGGAATNLNLTVPTFYSVSVANVGSANGTVLGATIKPGEVLNFSADAINNFFNSFAYNATGTEFIIIYVA
jgi:hypothetical protein